MQFLNNWHIFNNKTNMLIYIEYFLLNQLFNDLTNIDMEFIVQKNIATKYYHQKPVGNRKLNVKHSIS